MKESVQLITAAPHPNAVIHYGLFGELTDELHCVIEPAGKFVYVNPAFSRLLGYPRSAFDTLSLFELTHPDWNGRQQFTFKNICSAPLQEIIQLCRKQDGTCCKLQWRFSRQAGTGYYYGVGREISAAAADDLDEGTLKLVLDKAVDAVYVIDDDARIIYTNDFACSMLGYTREEMLGKSINEISPGVTLAEFHAARNSAQAGMARTSEVYQKHKDGSLLPVEVRSSLCKSNGKAYSCTIVRDITERKAAERKMAELEFAMEHAADAVYISTLDGNISYANKSACRSLGYSYDELTSINVMDVDPSLTPESMAEYISRYRFDNTQYKETSMHRRKDGVLFPVEITFTVNTFQGVDYSFAFVRDITERKAAEKRTAELQFAVEHAIDAIYIVSEEGNIRYANDSACRATGHSYDELTSMRVIDINPDWTTYRRESFLKQASMGINNTMVGMHRRKDGTVFPVEATVAVNELDGEYYSFAFVRDITERNRVLEELRASEARFKSLFEQSATGMLVFSWPERRLVMTNPAVIQMLGYGADELLGRTAGDITHPDDRGRHDDLTQKLIAGEIDHYTVDKQYCRKDNTGIWGRTTVSLVRDDAGRILYSIAQIQDITKAREAIRQSQELHHAIENSMDAVILVDKNADIYYVNKRACDELGYSQTELKTMSVYDLDPDLSHGDMDQLWNRAMDGHIFFERRHRRKDGSCFPVEIVTTAHEYEGNQYACNVCRNITERKQSLRQMEELKFAMENAVDPVFLFDITGAISYVNKSTCDALGYSYEELTSMNIMDFNPHFPKESWPRHIAEVRSGKLLPFEAYHQRKDGTFLPVEVNVNIKTYDDTEFLCAFARDISERKKAEKQMEELRFAVDNAVDAIYLSEPEGRIFYANRSACESTGYSYEELTRLNTGDIDPTLTHERRLEFRQNQNLTGPRTLETIHRRKDGSLYPVELTFNFSPRGDTGYSCAIVRDITERKTSARKMEELQFAIEKSHDGVVIYTKDAGIHYANDSICTALGYSYDELTSMTLFDISSTLIPDAWPERWRASKDYLSSGRQRLIEDYHRRKDGSIYPVEVSLYYAVFEGETFGYAFVRDITERKQAARQMEELQFAIENSVDGLIIYREDGSIHYVNDSLCRMLGYDHDELVAMTLFDIATTLDQGGWSERWQTNLQYLNRGQQRLFEDFHRRKDGTTFPVEVSSYYGEFGGTIFGYGFVRDISERKRAARQMEELQYAVQNAIDGVVIYDETARIRYANNSLCDALGYSQEEMSSMSLLDFAVELNETIWPERWRSSFEYRIKGIPRLFETWHRRRDGTVFPVEISSSFEEFDGIAIGYSFVRDITERKHAARQTEELRFAVDNANDAIYLNNREGDIYYVNKSACRQLGYSYEELTTMNIADIDPSFSRERLRLRLENDDAVNSIPPESWHYRKDGTKFAVEISFNARDYEGIEYLCSFVRDVTERKRIEQELHNHQEHLEELVESRTTELQAAQNKLVQKERLAVLGQLTGVVSHELRNPLGTIRSSIYLLRDRLEGKTGLIERAINRAERNIVRCDQIIEELLDYARAPQTIKQSISLDDWLGGVLEEYAFPQEITVKTRLQSEAAVLLEPERFERCIINVLSNACEAIQENPDADPRLLEIETRRSATGVEILITDNGPGIAEELQSRIFEPLFSTKGFGVGLGLPIVEQIMNQHEGKVTITSGPASGTMVTLSLPVKNRSRKEST